MTQKRKDTPSYEHFLAKQDKETQYRLKGKVWRGKDYKTKTYKDKSKQISTGHKALDAQIEGWPLGATTEITHSQLGIGEIRLLIPALRQLQQRQIGPRRIIWFTPPLKPHAPALVKLGLDLSLLTLVETRSIADTLWACEQALLSGACAATVCWTHSYSLSNRELRRLQLAAQRHNTWSVLFRDQRFIEQPSMSRLRLSIKSNRRSQLVVNIKKQPGKWADQTITLSIPPFYENWQRLPAELLPVPAWQRLPEQTHGNKQKLKLISNNSQRVTVIMPFSQIQAVH